MLLLLLLVLVPSRALARGLPPLSCDVSGDGNVGDSNSNSNSNSTSNSNTRSSSSSSGDRGRSRCGSGVARRDRNCRQYGSSTGHERNPAEQEQPEAMQPSTHRER
ncbi:hypothetical protein M0804_006565 [Polistes exclamans]|nr:hypothetical protein M0804_006565 [Polistes exclamans]